MRRPFLALLLSALLVFAMIACTQNVGHLRADGALEIGVIENWTTAQIVLYAHGHAEGQWLDADGNPVMVAGAPLTFSVDAGAELGWIRSGTRLRVMTPTEYAAAVALIPEWKGDASP